VGDFTVDLVFSKNDNYILSGSTDGKLYIYDLMRKTPLKSLTGHGKTLSAIGTHPNSGIATGGHDGTILFWKV
jgi:mitogen-activated protein kinase organizer 1